MNHLRIDLKNSYNSSQKNSNNYQNYTNNINLNKKIYLVK